MKQFLLPLFAIAGAVLFSGAARADLAPPPPPPKEVKFVIEVDENAKGSKLIVPQNLTNPRVRPRPGGGPPPPGKEGKEPLAVLEYEVEDDAAQPPRNRNHLIFAGLALTLAIALGGVWLVRRDGRAKFGSRGLALLIAAGGVLSLGGYVWANAPAPPRPKEKEIVVLPVALDGKLTLEMTRGGDTIRLVLDKTAYDNIKKEPKKPDSK